MQQEYEISFDINLRQDDKGMWVLKASIIPIHVGSIDQGQAIYFFMQAARSIVSMFEERDVDWIRDYCQERHINFRKAPGPVGGIDIHPQEYWRVSRNLIGGGLVVSVRLRFMVDVPVLDETDSSVEALVF